MIAHLAAQAQSNKFSYGIEAGPSITTLYGNRYIETIDNASLGYLLGMRFQYHFSETRSLKSGFGFERKGLVDNIQTTDQLGNPIGDVKYQLNFNYLTLPLLVQFGFGEKIKSFWNAGPYVGYLLNQEWVYRVTPEARGDNTSNFKRIDLGFTLGIGVTLPLDNHFSISSELRNNLGLYNTSALPVRNDGKIQTFSSVVCLGLTYRASKD